jgi:outer membrane protein TolC
MAFVLLASAAEVAAQQPLTIEAAVQATLARNAGLQAARAAEEEAAARAVEARSGFFPRVSFTETLQRGNQPVFVFSSLLASRRFAAENFALDALNHPGAVGFSRTTVAIEQLVFDGGRQRAGAESGRLRHAVAGAAADEAAAGLALRATQAFGRILIAQAAARAARSGLEAAREDRLRAERRRDAGVATEADVLAMAVHVADLEHQHIQAEGEAAIGRAELNRLMGAPVDAPIEAADTLPADFGLPADVKALLAEADAARPELRRADAAERLAATERRQARAALVPQVAAQAAFEASGTRLADRASAWLVGGELRWTFSTGGAELARRRAAAHALARARAEREDVRAGVHVEVMSALSNLQTAQAKQLAGRAAVDQARESQRIVRDRFEAGITNITDVLRASSAVLDAEARRTSALVDAIVSAAMLRRALGRTP